MNDMDKEDDRKPSGDESEVVFSQQEKVAATVTFGVFAVPPLHW